MVYINYNGRNQFCLFLNKSDYSEAAYEQLLSQSLEIKRDQEFNEALIENRKEVYPDNRDGIQPDTQIGRYNTRS